MTMSQQQSLPPTYDDDLEHPIPCPCGRKVCHGTAETPFACGAHFRDQCPFGPDYAAVARRAVA